mmetsp:Transcript_6076/g.16174  ORF Transcript_6076/g.16174 Transcript_6076/m.16174 type:complete len:230 (+) Transcript_6076:503-1192(+)|eukprot:CAMPEP_0185830932 /NCGR_PEP_ID=MMETSP1353-20130828/1174_1 /TAXON_ID=1077150 /ORGANISM="Erythrolobus australicus, Strain CCMP3124" /LENGTH=229 /DNA_ID=CAMNT_0028528927 /DNA_START=411 /DNA_END=1100 /DNA_ORIENTATION=-
MEIEALARVEQIELRVRELEAACADAEKLARAKASWARDPFAVRMQLLALSRGITSSGFRRCPSDYYEWELDRRRWWLQAASCEQLCKSVVLENTRFQPELELDRWYERYYCVIVQYTRKLDTDLIAKAMHGRPENAERGVPRKAFNFRLAEGVEELTGFVNNAVTPLGPKMWRVPILLSHCVPALRAPRQIWLGGGEVDLKWRVDVENFVQALEPIVMNITPDEPVSS